eukprot:6345273-Amphidinium_carterae.1
MYSAHSCTQPPLKLTLPFRRTRPLGEEDRELPTHGVRSTSDQSDWQSPLQLTLPWPKAETRQQHQQRGNVKH